MQTYDTRVESKIHSPANLAAARATCQLAGRGRLASLTGPPRRATHAEHRGAPAAQNAGVHPRPRLRRAHGCLAARVLGRRAMVERISASRSAFGLPMAGGQAAADDAGVTLYRRHYTLTHETDSFFLLVWLYST